MLQSDWFGAGLAFLIGVALATLNYAISRRILMKNPAQFATGTILRQMIQIFYLVALYFLGRYAPWDPFYLLIGGVLGITLPMFWFTYRLLKLNASLQEADGKEESSDGGTI